MLLNTCTLLQLVMRVLHLGFFSAYLSDQVIGGFTTGSAVHVFAAQLDKVLGIALPRRNGAGKLIWVSKLTCCVCLKLVLHNAMQSKRLQGKQQDKTIFPLSLCPWKPTTHSLPMESPTDTCPWADCE